MQLAQSVQLAFARAERDVYRNAMEPITRASAERNISGNGRDNDICFAPLERGEIFKDRAFYRHLALSGAKNKKRTVCATRRIQWVDVRHGSSAANYEESLVLTGRRRVRLRRLFSF